MSECPHGDDAAICPPCQRAAAPAPHGPTVRTVARHDGRCLRCDRPIHAGDPIALDPDGDTWTHEVCR